ncbi:MAG: molybdopterin-guanine dinucleotide biosynthesis protein B [Gluconacetobacter diazotrophicus]|nr:molybdopterin-guanine dinucleotide biosynthesis protein B [Gluconacetobacter diazotrophicus]
MKVVGIVGRSGSGKTTLIERLLPLLRAGGLRVSTVKRTHHRIDLDPPGKDSRRHRDAGAEEVILASDRRWALLRETPEAGESLDHLIARLRPVDLVLVEGFGSVPGRRLEVVRAGVRVGPKGTPLFESGAAIAAVASDADAVAGWSGPVLPLNDPASIRDWIVGT